MLGQARLQIESDGLMLASGDVVKVGLPRVECVRSVTEICLLGLKKVNFIAVLRQNVMP